MKEMKEKEARDHPHPHTQASGYCVKGSSAPDTHTHTGGSDERHTTTTTTIFNYLHFIAVLKKGGASLHYSTYIT